MRFYILLQHSLALTQAAAYIVQQSISIAVYLKLFRDDKIKLLSREFKDLQRQNEIPNSDIATWGISFEHIRHREEKAVPFLSFMSVLERTKISPDILLEAFPHWSSMEQIEALGTLLAFHIIVRGKVGQGYDMRQLVQDSVKAWLLANTEKEAWEQKALRLLAVCFPPADYKNWEFYKKKVAHGETSLQYSTGQPLTRER